MSIGFLSSSGGFLRCKKMILLSHCRSIQYRSTPTLCSSNHLSLSRMAVTFRKSSLLIVRLPCACNAATLRLENDTSTPRSSSYHCLISCSCSVNCTSVGFLRPRLGFSCVRSTAVSFSRAISETARRESLLCRLLSSPARTARSALVSLALLAPFTTCLNCLPATIGYGFVSSSPASFSQRSSKACGVEARSEERRVGKECRCRGSPYPS